MRLGIKNEQSSLLFSSRLSLYWWKIRDIVKAEHNRESLLSRIVEVHPIFINENTLNESHDEKSVFFRENGGGKSFHGQGG